MTFNLKTFFLALFFITQTMMAQETIENNVKQEAERMSKATLNGDYRRLIEYTHPNIIKFSGGKEKMLDLLEKQISTMANNRFTIEDVLIDNPVTVKLQNGEYQALIPKTTTINSNGQTIVSTDYLFGFSDSEGEKWTFVEAIKMKSAAAKRIFPNFETEIEIPKKEDPIIIDEEGEVDVLEYDENTGTYETTDQKVDKVFGIIGLGVGVIFLIMALIASIFLILYFKKKKKKEAFSHVVQKPIIKKIEKITCKECNEENSSESKYCIYCGYTLPHQ